MRLWEQPTERILYIHAIRETEPSSSCQ